MKIKLLSMILVVIMMLMTVVACKDKTGDSESTSVDSTPVPEKVLIAENGVSEYKIVRSEYVSEAFQTKYTAFFPKMRKECGVDFKIGDDFLRKDMDKSLPYEILFGAVNRVEAKEVYNSICYDGYAVKHVGNKIVIAAYTVKNMTLAIDALFDECLEIVEDENGNKKAYFVKEVVNVGTEKTFFNAENPINDYKIIYAPGEENTAKSFVRYLEKYTGLELEYLPDTTTPSDKEILIGDTNRKETESVKVSSKIGFVVKAVGTKVVMRAMEGVSLYNSMASIAENYMQDSPDFNLLANHDETHLLYVGNDKEELFTDADFRVMSFNILSEEWAAEAKDMEKRIPGVVGTILYYKPDVVGIQEISVKWYGVLKEYLGDTYEFVNTDANGVKNGCYTGLAYNKETVELLDSELYYYTVYNSKRLRVINMGHFKLKESGKTIVVTDTHFNANHKDATTENKNRVQQATEFIAKIDEYRNKYKCPIIMTGDYNSKDGSDPYNKIMSDKLIHEAKLTATKKGSIFLTYHNLGVMPGSNAESIDHIFYTGAITPVYYTTLMDQYLVIASDHCPIFADFKFD